MLAAPVRAALAQEPPEDKEGCTDSPLLSRMQGCKIMDCAPKEFDAIEVQVGKANPEGEHPKKELEGKIESLFYVCPPRLSYLQIARNAEAALRAAGYAIVFSGKNTPDELVVTAQKGAQWIHVRTDGLNEFTGYRMSAALVKGMAQEMTASADQMADEIKRTGHVAVYGVYFDTGKAALRPDSDAALSEILKLLKANPTWKMRVEGHTDNVGRAAANQALSQQRAEAVVAWLAGHGIDAARLSATGLGDSKPVADNASEDGRAKNRRVELVKN
jgi:outer membrane protein OmpA-like peptidoglycan-associated protein